MIGMKCDRGEQESTERTPVHHSPAVMFKPRGTGESKGAAIRLACLSALYDAAAAVHATHSSMLKYQTSECTDITALSKDFSYLSQCPCVLLKKTLT